MPKKRSHKNNEARLTVPEMVDEFWKSGVYPTKTGVLKLVQRAVKNALAREKRRDETDLDAGRAPLFSTLGLSKALKRVAKR